MAPPPKRKSIRRQRSQQLASEHGDSSAKARGQSWREQIVGRFLVIHQVLIEALRPYPNILNATERAGAIVDRVTSQPKNAIQKWHGQLNANISLVVDGFERQKQMIIDYINLVKQKFSKQSVKELIQWVQQRIEQILQQILSGQYDISFNIPSFSMSQSHSSNVFHTPQGGYASPAINIRVKKKQNVERRVMLVCWRNAPSKQELQSRLFDQMIGQTYNVETGALRDFELLRWVAMLSGSPFNPENQNVMQTAVFQQLVSCFPGMRANVFSDWTGFHSMNGGTDGDAVPPSEQALQVMASGKLCPELVFVGLNSEVVVNSTVEARLLSLYHQAQRRPEEWLMVIIGDSPLGTWTHMTTNKQPCSPNSGVVIANQSSANQWDLVPSILTWLRIFEHPFVRMHGWPWPVCGASLIRSNSPDASENDQTQQQGVMSPFALPCRTPGAPLRYAPVVPDWSQALTEEPSTSPSAGPINNLISYRGEKQVGDNSPPLPKPSPKLKGA